MRSALSWCRHTFLLLECKTQAHRRTHTHTHKGFDLCLFCHAAIVARPIKNRFSSAIVRWWRTGKQISLHTTSEVAVMYNFRNKSRLFKWRLTQTDAFSPRRCMFVSSGVHHKSGQWTQGADVTRPTVHDSYQSSSPVANIHRNIHLSAPIGGFITTTAKNSTVSVFRMAGVSLDLLLCLSDKPLNPKTEQN